MTKPPGPDFQTALQEAAKLKQASLKNKPERRAWEEAPSFFKWTCGNYDHVLWTRRMHDFEKKLAGAEGFRHEGNELYKANKHDDALLKYANAIAVFMWFQRKDDRSVEEVKFIDTVPQLDADDRHRVEEHLAASFLNAATILGLQKEHKDCIYACTKALQYAPSNAKALYRRAHAHYALSTSLDLEWAVKDLMIAAKLEPENVTIRKRLAQWKQEYAEQVRKDKKTFGNMFTKGELYTPEEAERAGILADEDSKQAFEVVEALLKKQRNENPIGWIEPPFSERARKQAEELGLDLDDPDIQVQLQQLHKRKLAHPNKLDEESGNGTSCSQSTGAHGQGAEAATDSAATSYKYPDTFFEAGQQLLRGELQWRWHFLVYIAMFAHFLYRSYRVLAASAAMPAVPAAENDETFLEDF